MPDVKWDYEDGFQYWYNAGRKRTWKEVGARFNIHMNTVRKRAEIEDWKGRAQSLDVQVRERTDRELAKKSASVNAELITVADAVLALFARRLYPTVAGPDGNPIPNPDRLRPGDISVREALELGKFKLLLTGQATSRTGKESDDDTPTLDEIEEELARVEAEAIALDFPVRSLPSG